VFKDSRKTFSIDQNIALNKPNAIDVIENTQGFPVKVRTKKNNIFLPVLSIIDLWHVYGEWWKNHLNPVNRIYYRLNVDERIITLFKDLNSDDWFVQHD